MAKTQEPPKKALPAAIIPNPAPKPVDSFLTMWFDETGSLQFKSENISVYAALGILRAATLLYEAKLQFTPTNPPAKVTP